MDPYYNNNNNCKRLSRNYNNCGNDLRNLKVDTANYSDIDQSNYISNDHQNEKMTPVERNIIYISLQNYNARSSSEISIEYNEHLKLIQHKNNGFLLVQSTKKPKNIGLVSSNMVEVLDLFGDIGDSVTPKRHYSNSSKKSYSDDRLNDNTNSHEIFDNLSPISVLNTPLSSLHSPENKWENYDFFKPLDIQSVQILEIQCNWAKIEILYSDNRRKVVKRFYQDFNDLKNQYYDVNMRHQLTFQNVAELNNFFYELISKLNDFSYFENWISCKPGDYDSHNYNYDDSSTTENCLSSPKLCSSNKSNHKISSSCSTENYNNDFFAQNDKGYLPMNINSNYYQANNNNNNNALLSSNCSPMNNYYAPENSYIANSTDYSIPLEYNYCPIPLYNNKFNDSVPLVNASVTSTPTKSRNKNLPPIPPPKSTPVKRSKINIISPFNSIEVKSESNVANDKSNMEIMKEIELEMENQQPQPMSVATKFYNTYKVKDKVRFKVFYNDGNDIFMMKVTSEIKIDELKYLIFKRLTEEFKKYQNLMLKRMTSKDVIYVYNKGSEGVYNPIEEDSTLRNIIDNSVDKITIRAEID